MYRKNANEADVNEDEEKKSFWRGTWHQMLLRTLFVFGFGLTGAMIFAIVWRTIHPAPSSPLPPLPECQDSAQIIQAPNDETDKRAFRVCPPKSHVDTTRLREGNYTTVLVRCLCDGHEKLVSEP
jgi:hypothetical protein